MEIRRRGALKLAPDAAGQPNGGVMRVRRDPMGKAFAGDGGCEGVLRNELEDGRDLPIVIKQNFQWPALRIITIEVLSCEQKWFEVVGVEVRSRPRLFA